jgi:hypothetical protein
MNVALKKLPKNQTYVHEVMTISSERVQVVGKLNLSERIN